MKCDVHVFMVYTENGRCVKKFFPWQYNSHKPSAYTKNKQ